MTAAQFTEWYDSIFIPEVKKYQKALEKDGSKVMLILDNAPTTPQRAFLTEKMDVLKHSRNEFAAANGPIGYRNNEAALQKTTAEEVFDS